MRWGWHMFLLHYDFSAIFRDVNGISVGRRCHRWMLVGWNKMTAILVLAFHIRRAVDSFVEDLPCMVIYPHGASPAFCVRVYPGTEWLSELSSSIGDVAQEPFPSPVCGGVWSLLVKKLYRVKSAGVG